MITEEMLSALQGVFPAALSTTDTNGIPNVSYITQVFYVDNTHVAISNQFFNKSMRNIKDTGLATVNVIIPDTLKSFYLYMKHKETQTEGELYDNMAMQLEAIASMTGMQDVFHLHAAEIFEVLEVVKIP